MKQNEKQGANAAKGDGKILQNAKRIQIARSSFLLPPDFQHLRLTKAGRRKHFLQKIEHPRTKKGKEAG